MKEQTKSDLPRIYSCYRSSFKLLSAFGNKMFYNIKFQTEAYSEPSRTSKMELFAKIVNSRTPLIIFTKSSILDVWLGSEYASFKTTLQVNLSHKRI